MKTINVDATVEPVNTVVEPDENQINGANIRWFVIIALIFLSIWVGGIAIVTIFAIAIIFGLPIGVTLIAWQFTQNWLDVPPNELWVIEDITVRQKTRPTEQEQLSQDRPINGLRKATQGWGMMKWFLERLARNGKIDLTKKVLLIKDSKMTFTTGDNLQVKVDTRCSAAVVPEMALTYYRYAVTDKVLKSDEMPEIIASEFSGLINKFLQGYIAKKKWKDDLKNGIDALNAEFIKFVKEKLPEFERRFGVRLSDALIMAIYLTDAEKKAFDAVGEAQAMITIKQMMPDIDQNLAAAIAATMVGKNLPFTFENIKLTAEGLEGLRGDFNFNRGGGGGQGKGNKGKNSGNQGGGNDPKKGQQP